MGSTRRFGEEVGGRPHVRRARLQGYVARAVRPHGELRHAGRTEYAQEGLAFEMELNRERDGCEIGPHTDSHGKCVATICLLPRDDSHADNGGTARSKSGREHEGDSTWESRTDPDFEVVRQRATCRALCLR